MKKRIICSILVLILSLVLVFPSAVPVKAAVSADGIVFTGDEQYKTEKAVNNIQSLEACIKLPTSCIDKGGVILGNYESSTKECLSFEILTGGVPRIYLIDNTGAKSDASFDQIDVRSDDFVHLAFVCDKGSASVFVNGELKQTVELNFSGASTVSAPFCVGGDLREKNVQFFKGKIKSIAAYSDLRSADEIKAAITDADKNDPELLFAYDLAGKQNEPTISDLSKNSNNLLCQTQWINEVKEPVDYDFSFMAIGDTQIVARDYPDQLHHIYDYVLENAQSKKVQHVFGLGDISDKDSDAEWSAAVPQIKRLDGVVKYSVIRGNHDLKSTGYKLNKLSNFDAFFGVKNSFYSDEYIDYYPQEREDFNARNTVHEFTGGGNKYLVVALDIGADDDVLNWANQVIAAHPKHNVIVTTHAYLHSGGSYYDAEKSSPSSKYLGDTANNGDEIWDKLVRKHKNIVMVLCGHSSSETVMLKTAKGDHGNDIAEILIDPQGLDARMGPTGMVATFYVSDGGKRVTVDYYSTVLGMYYKDSNHYTFNLNVVKSSALTVVLIVAGVVVVAGLGTLVFLYTKKKKNQTAE